MQAQPKNISIWVWAFGYFAAYAPYSLLTKALSDGRLGPKVPGSAILPLSTLSSVVAMLLFLWGTGWWRYATRKTVGGLSLPFPTKWTALSGLCGASILTTTTIAYTFEGVSIVLMMLLMRGGMLAMAPLVDALSRRKVSWYSWVALAFTLSALLVATLGRVDLRLTAVAGIDIALYLTAYFVRLRFMSRLAKSTDPLLSRRFFVEEQLVSTPAAFLAMALFAVFGTSPAFAELRQGFTQLPFDPQAVWALLIGALSQGTGIFGALVLLDARENSFSVPVNRASSVLAGGLATLALHWFFQGPSLDAKEAAGALLVVLAIAVLAAPSLMRRPVSSR